MESFYCLENMGGTFRHTQSYQKIVWCAPLRYTANVKDCVYTFLPLKFVCPKTNIPPVVIKQSNCAVKRQYHAYISILSSFLTKFLTFYHGCVVSSTAVQMHSCQGKCILFIVRVVLWPLGLGDFRESFRSISPPLSVIPELKDVKMVKMVKESISSYQARTKSRIYTIMLCK